MMISILHNGDLESTMLPFHCAAIHERSYDFSADLVERATSGCLSATYRLWEQF